MADDDDVLPENDQVDDAADDTDLVDDADDSQDDDAADDTAAADDSAGDEGKASRGETRQQKLANELRAERDARIKAEAERDTLRNGSQRPSVDSDAARRARDEKLALMTPEEKERFQDRELIEQMRQDSMTTRVTVADALDRTAFETMCLSKPHYAAVKDEVEKQLGDMRKNGSNAPRQALARYIIGYKADEAAANPKTKKRLAAEKTAAAERRAKSQGAITNAKGDAGGRKAGGEESLEDMKARLLEREARGDAR